MIITVNKEVRRGRLELERIQNQIKIEKDPLEDEHECFREGSKPDQHQIEENWVKVWKDWELEKEKIDKWKKSWKWDRQNCCDLEQEEMLSKEFQHNIENSATKLPTEREAWRNKCICIERQKLQTEIEREDCAREWESLNLNYRTETEDCLIADRRNERYWRWKDKTLLR